MKIELLAVLSSLLLTAACAASRSTPTPTIVPLDPAAMQPTGQGQATPTADVSPRATPLPFPSPTPTPTPLVIFALTPAPAAVTPTLTPAAARVEVLAHSLNLRQGPGLDYPVIGAVLAGQVFDIIGVAPGGAWVQVVADGRPGWISGKSTYTRITGSTAGLPAAQPPALSAATPPNPGPAPAASAHGLSGQLLFMTGSGGDLDLINVDGSGLRRLAGGVIDPALSPDGRQVAFVRWDGAEFGALYTIGLDGSGERAIVGDIRQPKSPTWSPDGQQIIISFQDGGLRDPQEQCKEFDFDDNIRLPDDIGQITKFRVSRDGIVVCYIRLEDLQWGLRRVELASGAFEDLPGDSYSFNPAWDPHQPWRVIYDGNKGLVQLDVTNGQRWPITTDLRDSGPVFSPDGQKLALTYKQHDHWEVYTLDLASGERRRLTKPPLLATPQYNSAAPAWSPDGSHLAFVTDRTGQWEIWVMNADGSDQRPLFSPAVQAQLGLQYRGVNERMLNWTE